MVRWVEDVGWRGKVGLISTPSADSHHIELMRVVPQGIGVYQTIPYVPNFALEPSRFEEAVHELEHCARALGAAGVQVIGQSGTPFSFIKGEVEWALELRRRLEEASEKRVALMGLSILEALQEKGYASVAVAASYYPRALCERFTQFLEAGGVRVLTMRNWADQGLFGLEGDAGGAKRDGDRKFSPLSPFSYPSSSVYRSVRDVVDVAPDAECILFPGSGVHTMDLIDALERDMRRPVISGDAAYFWRLLQLLEVQPSSGGWGSLVDSLMDESASVRAPSSTLPDPRS